MFFQVLFRVLGSSDLWQATLQFAALLVLPALAGVISERSVVTNIAMEGMMLMGAYVGVLMALIHAIVSINFQANQIVSCLAVNIAALGLTNYLLIIQTNGQGVPHLKD